jgi:hypothetical protein
MEDWNNGRMERWVKKQFFPFAFFNIPSFQHSNCLFYQIFQYSSIPTFQFLQCSKCRVGAENDAY